MNIYYGIQESPFGLCLIGIAEEGICHLSFHSRRGTSEGLKILREEWPIAKIFQDQAGAGRIISKIFDRSLRAPVNLSVLLKGTPFQRKVWKALLQIPPGKTSSYRDIARAIGVPKAARAVGTAVGENPVAFLVPCHRVIRSDGSIGGYHWGIDRKRAILAWEKSAPSSKTYPSAPRAPALGNNSSNLR